MKLNIEIDSESIEGVIGEGLKSMPKEELGKLLQNAVCEALTKCPDIKDLLVYRDHIGYSSSELRLGKLAEEAIRSIDVSEELAEIKKKMLNALLENHQQIVEDMFFRTFVERIAYDSEFQNAMQNACWQVLRKERSRNG